MRSQVPSEQGQYVYGDSVAALNLHSILQSAKNSQLTRRIGAFITECSALIHAVTEVENAKMRRILYGLLRGYIQGRASAQKTNRGETKKAWDHATNILLARAREALLR
jgi:hypothetical protein